MMKSEVLLFGIFFVFSIFLLSLMSAELNDTQISKAYTCLENKTANCSTSVADNIFTLLSIKKCKNKVLQASNNGECWPTWSLQCQADSTGIICIKRIWFRYIKAKRLAYFAHKITYKFRMVFRDRKFRSNRMFC